MTRKFPAIALAITLALASGPAEAGITAVFGGLKTGATVARATSAPATPAICLDETPGPIARLAAAPAPAPGIGIDILDI